MQRGNGGQLVAEDAQAGGGVVVVVGGVFLGDLDAEGRADAGGDVVADLVQLGKNVLLDSRADVARLEADRINEELLLDFGEGVIEQTRLGPVVGKGRRALAEERARGLAVWGSEETSPLLLARLLRVALVQRVGGVYLAVSTVDREAIVPNVTYTAQCSYG